MRLLELKVPPVAVTIIVGIAMFASANVAPDASFAFPAMKIVAVVLLLVAAIVAALGMHAFRRHETTVNPFTPGDASAIVTEGIFGYTRNPMYLGLALALAAWAVYLGNLLALAWLAVFVVYLTQFQIKPEERALEELFGQAFRDYRSQVRRWI